MHPSTALPAIRSTPAKGPLQNEDTLYEVQPSDSLWGIAEAFYGDGHLYESLLRDRQGSPDASLTPGESVTVPRKGYYLLCANDEEAGHDAAASDIRIFYCFDGNTDGDFFAASNPQTRMNISL